VEPRRAFSALSPNASFCETIDSLIQPFILINHHECAQAHLQKPKTLRALALPDFRHFYRASKQGRLWNPSGALLLYIFKPLMLFCIPTYSIDSYCSVFLHLQTFYVYAFLYIQSFYDALYIAFSIMLFCIPTYSMVFCSVIRRINLCCPVFQHIQLCCFVFLHIQ
jgi:hypothetical protein